LPTERGAWLILSSGGGDGAYGAGLLSGYAASGKMPQFTVVTGVSTGALLAPYAFAGPKYDAAMREAYTTINAGDIFEVFNTGESLLDTWPLKRLLAKRMTVELMADIAAEHRRGRRLFVATTNLDAERSVVWNMGAIAAKGGDEALALFRDVLLASASIPGFFPPVQIEVEANGRRFKEMHADGGMGAQLFVAPEAMLTSTSDARLPATDLYVIVNTKLTRDFLVTERTLVNVVGRSISVLVKSAMRAGIDRAYSAAKRNGIVFHIAYVPASFAQVSRGPFDPGYMEALFKLGYELGKNGAPFVSGPPDLAQ
jgi:hypothetical protein